MSDLALNLAQTFGCSRIEQLHGRAHLVVPAVALVPGVLNGELVTQDEIAASVSQWNDTPIPIDHPLERGQPISARQTDVLERQMAGRFYSANVGPDGKLRGEMWLDMAKLDMLGMAALTARLQAGTPVELSTAYFRDLEAVVGEHLGKAYRGIAHNLRPDHLALLPDSIGACSWQDGCGAPRINTQEVIMPEEIAPVIPVTPEVPEVVTYSEPTPLSQPEHTELLLQLVTLVDEFGGASALRDALQTLRTNVDAERNGLLAELQANARQSFTLEELATWATPALHKLADALRPLDTIQSADYAGRNGPRINTLGGEWQVMVAPEVK